MPATAFVLDYDRKPVTEVLAETLAWCESRAALEDARKCLRSEELKPWVLSRDRAHTVLDLSRARAPRVFGKARPIARRTDLRGGRLLVYFPDLNLADGAAEMESHGFLDVYNAPPWDTWIALGRDPANDVSTQDYLLAWVPPIFVDLVSSGIAVNPEGCIAWLEDAEINGRDELRHLCR